MPKTIEAARHLSAARLPPHGPQILEVLGGGIDEFVAAVTRQLGPGKKVVTVIIDTGLRYLNGDLFD